jgi:Ca-activated chloride channel family protein
VILALGLFAARRAAADSASTVVYTEPGELPRLVVADEARAALPLEHTHARIRVTGFVAEVDVTQSYRNDREEPIEATYIFPLPENAAVHGMRMVIGERVIEAKIERRDEARRTYARARRQGHTAALLEQERPNVFTQSVANIAPRSKIDVVLRYVQTLSYDAGWYEVVFPMVVGPRYIPAGVTDAARIRPAYLGRGERSGHDVSLELAADAGTPIRAWEAPTHEVLARTLADGTLRLTLAQKSSLPNRDFVLRYRAAAETPQATLFYAPAATEPGGGHYALVLHPPQLDVDGLVGRRELVFVVDVSGSMGGWPLAMARAAMREAVLRMRPVDTFNIYTFAGRTRRAFASPVPANDANVRRALEVVDGLRAGGGTELGDAVRAALGDDGTPGRERYVFFLTDGYVGNEGEIIATAKRFVEAERGRGRRSRAFCMGVGASVNRFLVEGLAQGGGGLGVYAGKGEDPSRAVRRFYRHIDAPVVTDVQVEWNGVTTLDPPPADLELFASHATIVHGRYRGEPQDASVLVRGRAGERELHIPVRARRAVLDGEPSRALGLLFARAEVRKLEDRLWEGHDPGVARAITELGLRHALVTRFTSFVAVDTARVVGDGDPRLIEQPVAPPEGIDLEAAGGRMEPDVSVVPALKGAMRGDAPAPEPPGPQEVRARTCGCRVAGAPDTARGFWLVAVAVLVICVRRRSRADEPARCAAA